VEEQGKARERRENSENNNENYFACEGVRERHKAQAQGTRVTSATRCPLAAQGPPYLACTLTLLGS
jgi:hypothetical protein